MSGFSKKLKETADIEKQQITKAGSQKAEPKAEPKKPRKASPVQMKRLKEFYGDKFSQYLDMHNLKSEDEITMEMADKTIEKITEYERRKG